MIDGTKRGGDTLTTGQATISSTATVIVSASSMARQSVTVVQHGTVDVFLGGSGVTTSTGLLLTGTKGTSVTLELSGALYGIVASGTQAVSFATVS